MQMPFSLKRLKPVFAFTPLFLAVLIWEIAAVFSNNRFVPHLPSVIATIWNSFWHDPMIEAQGGGSNGYAPHIFATLKTFLLCLFGGVMSAFIVSVSLFLFVPFRLLFVTLLKPWHVVPPLIAIPFLFALVGPGWIAYHLSAAFYAFIATSIFVLAALEEVPQNLISLARVGGANRFWIAWHVQAPSILPLLIGPLKVVASFTLGIVIILEFLAVPEGIGRIIKFAISYNSIQLLLAGIFWAALIGLSFDFCLDKLGRNLMHWAPRYDIKSASLEVSHLLER